ncbi:MAG: hypothetical protein PSV16_11525 [Flavobacterium sp.]|nr:hypothetical protein [Flavobacterium sp.]
MKNPPYRQTLLRKFPYLIIYELVEETVFIYKVFNTHQDPEKKY